MAGFFRKYKERARYSNRTSQGGDRCDRKADVALVRVYKDNVGGAAEGPLAAAFSISYDDPQNDPPGGTINIVGPLEDGIGNVYEILFFTSKMDGGQAGFNLYKVDGTLDFDYNFFNGRSGPAFTTKRMSGQTVLRRGEILKHRSLHVRCKPRFSIWPFDSGARTRSRGGSGASIRCCLAGAGDRRGYRCGLCETSLIPRFLTLDK